MICPQCGSVLVVSADQSRCVYQDDPNHGIQTWWDCPECRESWEDEEL